MLNAHDVETVIGQVAARLVRRYWWLDRDDLVNEAHVLCLETDVLEKATSLGAFHRRLRDALIDTQKTETKWRTERLTPVHVVDVSEDGTPFIEGEDGSPTPHRPKVLDGGWRGTANPAEIEDREWQAAQGLAEDKRPRHVPGGRSRLLDRLAGSTGAEFLEWADGELDRRYAKKRDLRTLLYGGRLERTDLWDRYARRKEISGGKRLVIDGIDTTPEQYKETLHEEWEARYRWEGDRRARNIHQKWPRVVSVDGATVVAAAVLRQPIR